MNTMWDTLYPPVFQTGRLPLKKVRPHLKIAGIAGTEKTLPKNKSRWFQDLMGKAIVLVLLSFALCLVISVLGGLFAAIINVFIPRVPHADFMSPEKYFRIALIRRNFPDVIVEIGSRIPVNLLDRLISSFAGYGLALLLAWGERKLR